MSKDSDFPGWHGTTIVAVRKGNKVVVAGDGQVSVGNTVMKHSAKKVRRLADGKVIGGFAGATADAFTLFERLEAKLVQYPDHLTRAAVEIAKDWRTDRYLRRLEALLLVADKPTPRWCSPAPATCWTPEAHGDHRHRLRRQLRRFAAALRAQRANTDHVDARGDCPQALAAHRRRQSASTPIDNLTLETIDKQPTGR
jgi:hypothetical protein